jgi:hypothetical protein
MDGESSRSVTANDGGQYHLAKEAAHQAPFHIYETLLTPAVSLLLPAALG